MDLNAPARRQVPFFDVAAVNAQLDAAACLGRVLGNNAYVMGQEGARFEADFAAYVGVDHAVGVGNGTDALILALRALALAPGTRVLTAANAGFYASTAAHQNGLRPTYVDVCPTRYVLTPAAVEAALTRYPDVGAVVVTHLYGNVADVAALAALCARRGVALVEDCAQAHGARADGRRVGSFGQLACFSFYPTKNLGALGDAGAVVTGDAELAGRLRALRQYGWLRKYEVGLRGGGNSRLDELQAAFLNAKLPVLDGHNAARSAIAAQYDAALADLPLQLPHAGDPGAVHHLYVVQAADRDALQANLAAAGVATAVHYPICDHQQPAYPSDAAAGSLPVTEALARRALSLPCYPGLAAEAVAYVAACVRHHYRNQGHAPS